MTLTGAFPSRSSLAFVVLIAATTVGRAETPVATSPNIVVILADDLGWADVGWHAPEIATPHLDALASAGVRLEANYVFPTCSPTRTALLTGRNPSRFGILGPISGRSEQAVPTETVTLADVLASRGYDASIVGKWHLGLRPQVGPRQFGFASTYGYLHGQIDPHTHRYKNGDRSWHRDDQFIEETGHATDLIAAEAIRRIESARKTTPFFLYVAFSVPHTPLAEEERWRKPYEGKIHESSRLLYAAPVTHMDDAVGRVVAALERTGQRENTLIVFSSDNGGPRQGEEGNQYDGRYGAFPVLADNKPLRGWKGEVYEGGIRVPAFVNWPKTLTPRVVTAATSVLDWLPTLAKRAGAVVDPRWKVEGVDVWPLLVGDAPQPDAVRTLYWRTARASALRQGKWKLVVTRGQDRRVGQAALFNLADDPNETTDLAQRLPNRVAALQEALRAQEALDH